MKAILAWGVQKECGSGSPLGECCQYLNLKMEALTEAVKAAEAAMKSTASSMHCDVVGLKIISEGRSGKEFKLTFTWKSSVFCRLCLI